METPSKQDMKIRHRRQLKSDVFHFLDFFNFFFNFLQVKFSDFQLKKIKKNRKNIKKHQKNFKKSRKSDFNFSTLNLCFEQQRLKFYFFDRAFDFFDFFYFPEFFGFF